jgi:hypothetical protein
VNIRKSMTPRQYPTGRRFKLHLPARAPIARV